MNNISFENTEIAFKYKSDSQLNKAYWLFRLIASNTLVKAGSSLSNFALKAGLPVNWAVKPTIYSHFVGGESIGECFETIRTLEKFNVKGILDYSVEGTESEEDIQHALDETLRTVSNAAKDGNIAFAVFKPTAFTTANVLEKASSGAELTSEEAAEAENFRRRVDILCKSGSDQGVKILIDAEDSYYQNFIDTVVTEMMVKYNKQRAIVFNTYQMYRHDRLAVLKKAIDDARSGGYFLGAKFVRGAYMERERRRAAAMGYPDPIHPDKASTDKAYDAALELTIQNIDRVAIFNGTHNERSSAWLAEFIAKKGLARNDDRVWFSQLYGMSDHISFNLAHQGYNVAKYIPYGPVKAVMPYLIRRTEENTSIAGQTSRELSLIIKEKKRRKSV